MKSFPSKNIAPPVEEEDLFDYAVVNVPQRPKVEDYPNQLVIITQMAIPKPKGKGFGLEQE